MGVLVDNLRRRAETAGDKPAFRFGTDDLSYGHLVERANQLATSLHQRGVGAGDRVGILQGKGMGNPLAVYGVLAAGAAYVPIDPAAPLARQAAIVADCGIRHVITDDERATRAGKLAATASQPLTLYGAAGPVGERTVSWDEIATASTATPSVTADIDGPAYIIFTSGSTGVPKGIVHSHRTGGAYAAMAAELYGLTDHDRLSNFPPLHFDQSTFDLFSGPSVGATTVIIGKDHQLVPASLSALIEAERLTVWYSVPLALIQLLLYGVLEERDHTSLRWVVYGGEPFPVKHLRALMAQWPNARFSNCYGPAETNQCTYHHLDPQDLAPGDDGAIPIGVPCPGMTTLVVDAEDRPVEPGDDGQLLVSSPTTMVGYWGRPDLDRASFLHRHPGGDASDADRYYRTGDLVRQGPDGLLDFLGRVDRQIKVRGARVELDEVELVLSSHEAVEEVAVAALPGEDGPTVAAWVSARPGHRPDEAGLRRHAGRQLTRVAIPSTIAIVDRFPRTTSGKIDYLTLTAGPGSRPTGDDSASTGKQDDDHR